MKFLDLSPLARLNSFLEQVDLGDYVITGKLEAYSCKLAGLDKKLSKSLDQDVQLGSSPLELSRSPVGPLSDSASRKTLVFLILTLNHIYPDYDFSLLRAHNFRKEEGLEKVEEVVDSNLLEVSKAWEETPGYGDSPFLDGIWTAIDEAVKLKECDIYSYRGTDLGEDPFGEDMSVWSFNYFFYNKKEKRILYFACRGKSKRGSSEEDSDASDRDDEGYTLAGEMDMYPTSPSPIVKGGVRLL